MKKLLLLTIVFGALVSTSSLAQSGPNDKNPSNTPNAQSATDAAAMLKQMKEKISPKMVEETGLTLAQADKIVEINFELRQAMAAYKDLSDEERSKKIADWKVTREKRWSEIPLTPEQIKSVYAFYEGMGKNNPPKKD